MHNDPSDTVEMVFTVESDLEDGAFVACWDDPAGGGITTQAETLAELTGAIKEAVACHFTDGPAPRRASLHFASVELELA